MTDRRIIALWTDPTKPNPPACIIYHDGSREAITHDEYKRLWKEIATDEGILGTPAGGSA